MIIGDTQQLNMIGKRPRSGEAPSHQSSQKYVCFPFWMECFVIRVQHASVGNPKRKV
jgi:hypothetical protein